MDSIRKEIEAEIKRTRLDKGRLYDLILKIVDNCGTGGAGGAGPQGVAGPAGPAGPRGPACDCKCAKEESKPSAKPAAKKTTTTKKKAPVVNVV